METSGSSALVSAMRCWCCARARRSNPLPHICRSLQHEHAGVIAVVVCGLMNALHGSLGREPRAGSPDGLSGDERLIIDLLREAPFEPVTLGKGELEHLHCAVASARVMFRLIPGMD